MTQTQINEFYPMETPYKGETPVQYPAYNNMTPSEIFSEGKQQEIDGLDLNDKFDKSVSNNQSEGYDDKHKKADFAAFEDPSR